MVKHTLSVMQHNGQKLVAGNQVKQKHGQDHSEALDLTGIQLSSKAQEIQTPRSQARPRKAWAKALREQILRSSQIFSKAMS
ncbi:hypothetical protein [Synechococcus sp. UW179A]|uniref:hypothetical protein n=1 Tax=Synechococcus sp. UW179A TaxID=2575510 RepID=UPI00148354D5|nr:hypothetical protein [Synechococcus sp. UW179A]